MTKLGINEKSLPKNISWMERLKLAKELGFSFIEMSIDETDERLSRLDWSKSQRLSIVEAEFEMDIPIDTMMLSGLRRYPLGSEDILIQEKAVAITKKAIILAHDLGIRNIQIAGYDEYYNDKSCSTRENFMENLATVIKFAAQHQVMIAVETMDDRFINSIHKIRLLKTQIKSPWLQAYPDLGNINAWSENSVARDLEEGIGNIVSVHLKDTLNVTSNTPGKFKDVAFGTGDVDFKGLLKTLKRLNYAGTYTIEMWSETLADPIPVIKTARDFFLDLFEQLSISLEK